MYIVVCHVVHSDYLIILGHVQCTIALVSFSTNDSSYHLQCVCVHTLVVGCLLSVKFQDVSCRSKRRLSSHRSMFSHQPLHQRRIRTAAGSENGSFSLLVSTHHHWCRCQSVLSYILRESESLCRLLCSLGKPLHRTANTDNL